MVIRCRTRVAFTLLESLTVFAIISVLLAILLPAIAQVRESARRSSCANNLRQIGLALTNFDGTKLALPPSWGSFPEYFDPKQVPPNLSIGSMFHHLLPYLGEQAVYDASLTHKDAPGGIHSWEQVQSVQVNSYICPSDPTYTSSGLGCYASNWEVFPFEKPKYRRLEKLPDGQSNVAVVAEHASRRRVERGILRCYWGGPNTIYDARQAPPTRFVNAEVKASEWAAATSHVALQILLADGAVKSLRLSNDVGRIWRHLSSPDDSLTPVIE